MIKHFIFYFTLICIPVFSAEYDVGDVVDTDDQEERFTICNGEYFHNDFKLSLQTHKWMGVD